MALFALSSCQTPAHSAGERVAGEYLVRLSSGVQAQSFLERAFGKFGLKVVDRLEVKESVFRIRLSKDPGPVALKDHAEGFPEIRWVQPNFQYSLPAQPGPEGRPPPPDPGGRKITMTQTRGVS